MAYAACLAAEEPPAKLYTIPSWGDYAVVYSNGLDPAMDSPRTMENMFSFWKGRGYTGVFIRSDLQQYAPFIVRNPRAQMNPPLALMWKHIDNLAERFDYFEAAQKAAARTGLEFWVYHPHIYSDGAPKDAGTPGPGRMLPWSYESKLLAEHPEMVSIDRKGRKYWMVPEYAYPEARKAKAAEFAYMASKYGIKHFIATMRSEVSQLQAPADKADRFGFNPPVAADMQRLYSVDIMTDTRFDVDAPGFDPHDPMVEKWHDLRGSYLTQLWREVREALKKVDPAITFGVTLAGEHIGPPLGNWRTDWRAWVDEGLVDYLIAPVFFEATLDHEAGRKGYFTSSRAGVGTVSHEALKAYIQKSRHPEVKVIATGGAPAFLEPAGIPAGADGMQIDGWYAAYQLAWYERWSQWRKDLADFGHIRFIEQNFDAVTPKDTVMPAGAWGTFSYDPAVRACPGAWWRLGDGSDARPFAQTLVRHGRSGKAIKLTSAADGSGTLTGWHNASPDRSKYAGAVDTSVTCGRCVFEFWLLRMDAESGVAAWLQGDAHEQEVGLRVASRTGKVSYSTGMRNGAAQWQETNHVLPVGKWQRFSVQVDIDHLRYGAMMGDGSPEGICRDVPISAPKPRTIEQPGVNLPISVPSFKDFKSVLFEPQGPPGKVSYLDDVTVHWQPAAAFAEHGQRVELAEDFESGSEASWDLPKGCNIACDTSFGSGTKSLHASGGAPITARTKRPLQTGTRLTLDLDVFVRSGEKSLAIIPNLAAKHPHSTSIGWKDAEGRMMAGVSSGDGMWRLWTGGHWTDSTTPVHYDVWNHLQLTLNESGSTVAAVQPVGQVAAPIGYGRLAEAAKGTELTLTIDPSATPGHITCYDNVAITSGPKAAKAAAGVQPVLTVPVRVHLMESATNAGLNTRLKEPDVARIFEKANRIWSQGGIHLEVESVDRIRAGEAPRGKVLKEDADLMRAVVPRSSLDPEAINIFYVHDLRPNGFYYGEAIAVKDTASLRPMPGGMDEPLPRVTAHEIGHALGLSHRQDGVNLMSSGNSSYSLNTEEIAKARLKAAAWQARKAAGR